jgi:DNA-binding XRE family transcriptional regulator
MVKCHRRRADKISMATLDVEDLRQVLLINEILNLPPLSRIDLAFLARLYRAQSGLTIEKAASKIGIGRHLLGKIESGELVPKRGKLEQICRFYGPNFRKALRAIELI